MLTAVLLILLVWAVASVPVGLVVAAILKFSQPLPFGIVKLEDYVAFLASRDSA